MDGMVRQIIHRKKESQKTVHGEAAGQNTSAVGSLESPADVMCTEKLGACSTAGVCIITFSEL